jgi:hypothetical protein
MVALRKAAAVVGRTIWRADPTVRTKKASMSKKDATASPRSKFVSRSPKEPSEVLPARIGF